MERIGRAGRSLGAVAMISLTLVGCATQRGMGASNAPPADAGPGEVARRCEEFARSFGYAEKSVGGRLAVSAVLTPLAVGLGVGLGVVGTMAGDPRGFALAVIAPIEMGQWTAKASKDNRDQREGLRKACEEGGGPDTVVAAQAVRDLAEARERERSSRDAVRLYRDTLVILDRAGAGESEDAATVALSLASLVEKATPADPEVGPLYNRALRIRESQSGAQPRELASLFIQYGDWLRAAGQPVDAEAAEARADALNRDAQAAEDAARAAAAVPVTSVTDITVDERCSHRSVNVLDQVNHDVATQGGLARVLAVDCGDAGQISAVRLTTPTGASEALTFSDQENDPAERIRATLFTSGP
jgi:hypothetical protein